MTFTEPIFTGLPDMKLEKPTGGWIRLNIHFADSNFTVFQSNVWNPLADIWLWAMYLAHGYIPEALKINEEGSHMQLSAAFCSSASDTLLLTARRYSEDLRIVYDEWHWRTPRIQWLQALGRLYHDYFTEDYDAAAWQNGNDMPEMAVLLPWCFPALVAHSVKELEPMPWSQLVWLLAQRLDLSQYPVFESLASEDKLRLVFQFTYIQQELASLAWDERWVNSDAVAETDNQFQLWRQTYFDTMTEASFFLEELEMLREGWHEKLYLAEASLREPLIAKHMGLLLQQTHRLLQAIPDLLPAPEFGPSLALSPDGFRVYKTFELVSAAARPE